MKNLKYIIAKTLWRLGLFRRVLQKEHGTYVATREWMERWLSKNDKNHLER